MKGYRTLVFNALAALALSAEMFLELAYSNEVQFFINDEWMPVFMAIVILCNIVLRLVTTTPVGKPT